MHTAPAPADTVPSQGAGAHRTRPPAGPTRVYGYSRLPAVTCGEAANTSRTLGSRRLTWPVPVRDDIARLPCPLIVVTRRPGHWARADVDDVALVVVVVVPWPVIPAKDIAKVVPTSTDVSRSSAMIQGTCPGTVRRFSPSSSSPERAGLKARPGVDNVAGARPDNHTSGAVVPVVVVSSPSPSPSLCCCCCRRLQDLFSEPH
jgi:hypothetical protein